MHRAIKEIEAIHNENSELRKMHEQNKQRIDKASALIKENEVLQKQRQEKQQKEDELKVTLNQIRTELTEARQKSQDVDTLRESRDTQESRVAILESENYELKTKPEQISDLSTTQEPEFQEEIQKEDCHRLSSNERNDWY